MFKVDRNIPIPGGPKRVVPDKNAYPWNYLNVGDSFFVPLGTETVRVVENRLRASITTRKRRVGMEYGWVEDFTIRVEYDERGNAVGVRCWRIK